MAIQEKWFMLFVTEIKESLLFVFWLRSHREKEHTVYPPPPHLPPKR